LRKNPGNQPPKTAVGTVAERLPMRPRSMRAPDRPLARRQTSSGEPSGSRVEGQDCWAVRAAAAHSSLARVWRAARNYLLAGGIKGRQRELDAPPFSKNGSHRTRETTMPAFTGGFGTFARTPVRDLAAETATWARHAAAQAGSSRCRTPGAPFAKDADRRGCGPDSESSGVSNRV
jgi:hypothetical protein